jgi:hypothetical protein
MNMRCLLTEVYRRAPSQGAVKGRLAAAQRALASQTAFPDRTAQENGSSYRVYGPTEHDENGHPEDVKHGVESADSMSPEIAQKDIEPMAQTRDQVSH